MHWKGRCGEISEDLLGKHTLSGYGGMVLVSGLEGMEKSMSTTLQKPGWLGEDMGLL